MNLTKTDGPIGFGMHEVRLSTMELLILEVALNDLRERLDNGLAGSDLKRSTVNLWMKNRTMFSGIHESFINRFERDTKSVLAEIGIK